LRLFPFPLTTGIAVEIGGHPTNAPMSDDFAPKSEFLATLIARGFVHQCTDFAALDAEAAREAFGLYRLRLHRAVVHIGSLLPIMLLACCNGPAAAAAAGRAGTTRVGDPSGKDESRKLLTIEQIDANKASIRTVFEKFSAFGDAAGERCCSTRRLAGGPELHRVSTDVGRHFFGQPHADNGQRKARWSASTSCPSSSSTICVCKLMISRDKQASWALLQMGGSDQWGNIVWASISRRMGCPQTYGLTRRFSQPLPARKWADGGRRGLAQRRLLSRTIIGNIGATARTRTWSAFLKLFTFLPLERDREAHALQGAEINEARRRLRPKRPRWCMGGGGRAAAATAKTISRKARWRCPCRRSGRRRGSRGGLGVLTAFVKAGLVASTGEARRQVKGGGLRVNDAPSPTSARRLETRISRRTAWRNFRSQEEACAVGAGVALPPLRFRTPVPSITPMILRNSPESAARPAKR